MATATLVLSNPLCFLLSKYDKLPVKTLKSALLDFYDPAVISNAKKQLVLDMKNIILAEKPPNVPDRRGGESRSINEIDDMFVLVTFLDEKKLLNGLPVYVADSPDNMPSMRLYEGDLKILMSLLEKMSDKLTSHGSAIAAIVNDLHNLQSKSVPSVNTANVQRPSMYQGVINNTASTQSPHTVNDVRPGRSGRSTVGNPNLGKPYLAGDHNKPTGVEKPIDSWANRVAAASTPHHSRIRYSRPTLSTATDDDHSDNPFIEQQSRKQRRSNKRKLDSSVSPTKTDQQQISKATDLAQHRGRSAVYGRSSNVGAGLAAANKLIPKGVYCIDNIDVSFDVEDIVQYVRSQGITVMSCFEAKPRFRRSDNYTNDRKAFRLCINNDHRNKLLDSSRWPDSVVVSDWFFKSQQSTRISRDNPLDKRPRPESPSHQPRSEQDSSSVQTTAEVPGYSPQPICSALLSGLPLGNSAYHPITGDVLGVSADVHQSLTESPTHTDDMEATIITQDSLETNVIVENLVTPNNTN